MRGVERRAACRLPLTVPVRLEGRSGPVPGVALDVSSVGIRVQVRTVALGFAPTLELLSTAEGLDAALAARLGLTLEHPALDASVRCRAEITRLSIPLDAPDSVELGCRFETVLDAQVLAALGLPAPTREQEGRGAVHALHAARRFYRARLESTAAGAPPPLVCHADHVGPSTVRVRIPRAPGVEDGVAAATVYFTRKYGTCADLEVLEGRERLWRGRVRTRSVELPHDRPADMHVTLAYERSLRPMEVQRLRLPLR